MALNQSERGELDELSRRLEEAEARERLLVEVLSAISLGRRPLQKIRELSAVAAAYAEDALAQS